MNLKKIKKMNMARLAFQKRWKIRVASQFFDFLIIKQDLFNPQAVKTILILREDNKIGDSIVASGLIKALERAGYAVDVVTGKDNAFIYQAASFAGKVFSHSSKKSSVLKTAYRLRRQQYDLLLDFGDDISASHYAFVSLINAKYTLGFNKEVFKRYNVNIPYAFYDRHVSERYKTVMQKLGLSAENYRYEITIPDIVANAVTMFMAPLLPGKLIVINPFAACKTRLMSDHQLGYVIEKIKQVTPDAVIIIIGPPALMESLKLDARAIKSPFTSFLSAAAIVKQADLIITPDTSWVHLACSYQKPLIALYANAILEGGFINNKVWAPNYAQATQIITQEKNISSIDNKKIGVEIERYMLAP